MTVVRATPDRRASKVAFLSSSRENGRERGADDHARMDAGASPKLHISRHAGDRANAVTTSTPFSRAADACRNYRFVGVERDAFLQLPAQHGDGLPARAREFVKVLHEDANDGIRQNQSNILVLGAQAADRCWPLPI